MLDKLIKEVEKPELYKKTEGAFWDDEHISKQMLKAHLNPDFEGASRKKDFISKSAAWIAATIPPVSYPDLLDIGCGPGIYAEHFTKAGYHVTGIDFSRRSINHAIQSARQQELNITYLYQNYLNMELNQEFDGAAMIYCDYGALSQTDRKILMDKVCHHLKPGGKFLLDVFSTTYYENFQENQTWEHHPHGGFWNPGEHLALTGRYKYPDHITLEQTTILSAKDKRTYYLWNTCFTPRQLKKEAEQSGFKTHSIYSDISGTPYTESSPTIAILLEK